MAKKVKQISENNLKEKCTACGSKEFAIDQNPNQTRRCSKCQHVWLPHTKDQLMVIALSDKLHQLDTFVSQASQLAQAVVKSLDDKEQEIDTKLLQIKSAMLNLHEAATQVSQKVLS